VTIFYWRQLAQQEAVALRHLYAAHGRIPKARPLILEPEPEMVECGPSTGAGGYERHRQAGTEVCPNCATAAREVWRHRRQKRRAA